MLPNFLYIGTGRAGSDWMTRNLSMHPDIFIPRRKGTRYFIDNHKHGQEWYEEFFAERHEKALGEVTNAYLRTEHTPAMIKQLLPDVKLICNLRSPVDRAFSSYNKVITEAKDGEKNLEISFREKLLDTPRFIEDGLYFRNISRYLEFFPREQILILFYDDMKSDPDAFLREIYRFLGVDENFEAELVNVHLNASSTLASRSSFLYRIYRAALRFKLNALARYIDSIQKKKKPARVVKKPPPAELQSIFDEYFKEDVEQLETLTGRNLDHWKNF